MLVLVLEFSKISASTLDQAIRTPLLGNAEGRAAHQGHRPKERRSSKTEDESLPTRQAPDQIGRKYKYLGLLCSGVPRSRLTSIQLGSCLSTVDRCAP
jgi:hypothetical protein